MKFDFLLSYIDRHMPAWGPKAWAVPAGTAALE